MHASALFVVATTGFAAAQSSTSAASSTASTGVTSGCGTQIDTIISACLGSTQPQLKACDSQDWDCLCTQSQNVLTCYNNCPGDPNKFGAEQTSVSYCNAAKAYGSSASASMSKTATATASMSASASGTMSTAEATASSTATGTSTQSSATKSASGAAASATHSGSASSRVVPAGLAAIFGLAALL
ncbi:hypothetical protein AC578_7156 [Pseudocercospora eumusae]|uniref:GPI anchored serine-threonine rich protein n=1 Tax=Pseudocercospora eumusae TaxID=321146 RepID=A0A139HX11_9PEZI|nr:hypothetical protein AC578_7156 [Pseudocercospora eumusae]